MSQNNINTTAIQNFLNQVKAAEASHQREIKLDLVSAKALSHTLALVMTRLVGNYESLIGDLQKDSVVSVSLDGGNWDEK